MPAHATMKLRLLCALSWLALSLLNGISVAEAQKEMKEYWDKDYNFAFRYPAGWKLRQVREGEANREIRVIAQAPDGGSFMVVIEKLQKPTEKAAFESSGDRAAAVEKMAQETIDEIYRTISANIQATGMKIGEIRDISSQAAVKYYVSTLHQMKAGHPIIVAGIHALPFGKAYRVDFMMTAPWNSAAQKENEAMMLAFNSFQLIGEAGAGGGMAPEGQGTGAAK
jgi:hypothetical protein